MLNEFKKFALRGNVMDMAVGIIIGAAFGKIIASFVKDVLMPPLGLLLGKVDFSQLYFSLNGAAFESLAAAEEAGAPILRYGAFLQTVVDFVIVAFAIFLMVRAMNSLKKKEEEKPAAPAAPPKQEVLLAEIRDLLAKR